MKVSKIMRGIVFCLVAALLAGLVLIPPARADNTPGQTQEYDIDQPVEEFPIMRGSSDWERLGLDDFAADSWKSALHIPQAVQDRMTTRALLISYLNRPNSYDNVSLGILTHQARLVYNAAKKLNADNGLLDRFERREDAPQVLLDELRSWGDIPADELQHLTRNMLIGRPISIVIIAVQQEYTSRMTKNEMYDLVKLLVSYRNRGSEEDKYLKYLGFEFFQCANIVKRYQYHGRDEWATLSDEEREDILYSNPLWMCVSIDNYLIWLKEHYTGAY